MKTIFLKHISFKHKIIKKSLHYVFADLFSHLLNFANTSNLKLNLAGYKLKVTRKKALECVLKKNCANWPGFILSYVYGYKFELETTKFDTLKIIYRLAL